MNGQERETSLPRYLKGDDLTEECRALIPSLPLERDWLSTHYHLYQGFWFHARYLDGVLWMQRHFTAADSDTLLVTTPKSGTTWLKALLFSLLHRSQLSSLDHPLLRRNPHDLVPFLEHRLYLESNQSLEDPSFMAFPRLLATHMPFASLPVSVKDSKCKVVYLCRNPKDTFVSMWSFTNSLRLKDTAMDPSPIDEAFDSFCRGVSLYGPYWDHVLQYYRASLELPDRVLFIRYEEMKESPREHLRRLARFLGCPFSEEEEAGGLVDGILTQCSFESLSKLEVNQRGKSASGMENRWFFRKGEVGDWVNYLSPEMIARIDHITEEKLQGSGLKF
ncbi:hypothetical protein SAY86_014189 [Trapa natans]|uniref:Sulfotransferase n=1 Tax=Trapa natans TaxID=22666 RepID=A0AAN7QMK7_TRANT|nr:hypothetical protein SAY86_014189 [Trapa natans]